MHFSIARLLLAVGATALAFGVFGSMGAGGVALAVVIGTSLGGVCLILKPEQVWPVTRTALIVTCCGLFALLFMADRNPPNDGARLEFVAVGCFIGLMCAILMSLTDTSSANEPTDDSEDQPQEGS